jgi:uncharacterized protein (TIGR02001 family)
MRGPRSLVRLWVVGVNLRHCIVRGCGIAGLIAGAPLYAHEFHGYLTLTSDYVFRGASQSNEDPTVQAGLDYVHPSGVFAGAFAAHTEFPENPFGSNPGSLEFDAYLGYSREAGRDWSWDVAAFHYDFPDSTGFDYSYDELAANLRFRDFLRLGATVSGDAGAGGASGWTAEVELRRSFGERYQLSGSLGRYGFERTDWDDYLYWDLGVSAVAGLVTFDLRYFDTDGDQAGFAGRELTGSRLVGSVSVGF